MGTTGTFNVSAADLNRPSVDTDPRPGRNPTPLIGRHRDPRGNFVVQPILCLKEHHGHAVPNSINDKRTMLRGRKARTSPSQWLLYDFANSVCTSWAAADAFVTWHDRKRTITRSWNSLQAKTLESGSLDTNGFTSTMTSSQRSFESGSGLVLAILRNRADFLSTGYYIVFA